MFDTETLGKRAGCVVLSIGAVTFDENGLGTEFHAVLSVAEQMARGLTVDRETFEWWEKQSPEARATFAAAHAVRGGTLAALEWFASFLARAESPLLWANGAEFDPPILEAVYAAWGLPKPWEYRNVRCFRTLYAITPGVPKPPDIGTHHNALDDAKWQATWALSLLAARSTR